MAQLNPARWTGSPSSDSVQVSLPVPGHATSRPRRRLVERMLQRRRELGSFEKLLARVVPEPVLAWLVTPDDRVPSLGSVVTCVLRGG
jgi:hypothetical protein